MRGEGSPGLVLKGHGQGHAFSYPGSLLDPLPWCSWRGDGWGGMTGPSTLLPDASKVGGGRGSS